MNLSFEHTLPIDGKSSYIASLALVNPSHLCPCEPHNRAEYRRAAKLKRSPEQNSQTIQQLSPIAIPLESGNILSVNLAKQRLLDWAKRSHIQSLVYITFDSNGQLLVEYWAYQGSCLSSLAISPYRCDRKTNSWSRREDDDSYRWLSADNKHWFPSQEKPTIAQQSTNRSCHNRVGYLVHLKPSNQWCRCNGMAI